MGRVRTHPVHPSWLRACNGICRSPLVTLVTYSKYLIICQFHVPTRKRKSSKEKQNSKKKNGAGLPQGVSNFTDTYLEKKFAMKLQLAFKSTKKSAVMQPPSFFLFTKWGKICQKGSFNKSILAFFYHFNLTV